MSEKIQELFSNIKVDLDKLVIIEPSKKTLESLTKLNKQNIDARQILVKGFRIKNGKSKDTSLIRYLVRDSVYDNTDEDLEIFKDYIVGCENIMRFLKDIDVRFFERRESEELKELEKFVKIAENGYEEVS